MKKKFKMPKPVFTEPMLKPGLHAVTPMRTTKTKKGLVVEMRTKKGDVVEMHVVRPKRPYVKSGKYAKPGPKKGTPNKHPADAPKLSSTSSRSAPSRSSTAPLGSRCTPCRSALTSSPSCRKASTRI